MIAWVRNSQGGGSGSSFNVTLSGLPGSGNLLVVAISNNSGVTSNITSITDNASNSYARAKGSTWASGYAESEIWYAYNVTPHASSHQLTINQTTAGASNQVNIDEFSGIVTASNPLDQTSWVDTPSSTTINAGPTGTLVQANELVVMSGTQNSAGTHSVGSGYSNFHGTGGASSLSLQSKVVAATTAVSGTMTTTVSGSVTGIIATFKGLVPPDVTGVSPNTGSLLGGTAVTVSGTDFVSGATVSFGGSAATSVTFVNSTSITCNTPSHTVGAVNVVVTNPDTQSDTLINGFTYFGYDTTENLAQSIALNAANAAFLATINVQPVEVLPGSTSIAYKAQSDSTQGFVTVTKNTDTILTPPTTIDKTPSHKWQATLTGTSSQTPELDGPLTISYRLGMPIDLTTDRLAQSIASGAGGTIAAILLNVMKTASDTIDYTVEIHPDSAGSPSGTPITNGTATIAAASVLTSGFNWASATFATPPTLTASTTYWIVVKVGTAGSSKLVWRARGGNSYASGTAKYSANSGTAWTTQTDMDFLFSVLTTGGTFSATVVASYKKRWM